MKKILLSLAATAAVVAAAAPAAAQPWNGHDNNARGYAGQQYARSPVDGLERRINAAAQQRRISWNEQRQLISQLRQIQPIAYRVQSGQANRWERQRLEQGVARIESALNRYARNDRYDGNGRFDRDNNWRR